MAVQIVREEDVAHDESIFSSAQVSEAPVSISDEVVRVRSEQSGEQTSISSDAFTIRVEEETLHVDLHLTQRTRPD